MLPEKLELLMAVVRKNKVNGVLARLLYTGFFHPIDPASIPGLSDYPGLMRSDFDSLRWKDIKKRFDFIVNETGFSPSITSTFVSYGEAEVTLSMIEENIKPLIDLRYKLFEEISNLQNLIEKKPVYFPIPYSTFTFVHFEIGKIKKESLGVFENLFNDIVHIIFPSEEKEGYVVVGVLILKRDSSVFERIKKEIGWLPLPPDVPISSRAVDEYKEEIEKLRDEIEHTNRKIQQEIERNREILNKIATSIEIFQKISLARSNTLSTETSIFISGWIPENKKKMLLEKIVEADPIAYCQCIPAEKTGVLTEQIPVYFKHNRFLKPFELIVQTYGLPRYKTLDPTPFVAFSFLLMFGAMFGDIGHGAVFVIAGLLMLWKLKGSFSQVGYLVSYTGISSVIFGILYGSFFGIEFRPVWINPMENISGIFRTCIIIGVIILTAGIILNIINKIISRDKTGLLFDKAGILSGLAFWTAAAMAGLYLGKAGGILIKVFGAIFLTAIFTIFSKVIIDSIKHGDGILVGFIEGILHVFEIMMGYLANTVSFIRIAAFSLNHIGFFMTIFAISDLLKNSGIGWLSLPTIILGNIFVIVLEGLVVMIQTLRLNYYEFFSRFFAPGSISFQPLVIKAFNEKIEEYLT
ncbi:MAG: hypothetical protein NC906_05625 [Candidatus Omnitrophica bacterium]|nr:hypothetical protein [Candidatus Omnitrophota bacterium]